MVSFLKVLNYPVPPAPNDETWAQSLFRSEKRVIHPVLYYLLTRLPELEKRAYLAKYLVPFVIPEDIPIDAELRDHLNAYKDRQAEFQVVHQ